jgi:hypothetical protein
MSKEQKAEEVKNEANVLFKGKPFLL